MPSDLYRLLCNVVSPFDEGVSGLSIRALRHADELKSRPNKTAAVLVPILDKPEPEILLTVRSHLLSQHPGQVSFPGGSADNSDQSAISTALREAKEEIGLSASQVAPIGFLDRLDTVSDYRVLPVVGLVQADFVWRPDHREVSEVFTVPLDLAMDKSAYRSETISHEGRTAVISSLQWQGHRIWGVTAAILLDLAGRMNGSHPQQGI